MSRDKGKKRIAFICNFLAIAMIVGVIAICIPLTIPRFMGYEIYDVVSGSMEPEIPVGAIVFAQHNQPDEVQAGDIIVYYGEEQDGSIITHRVVENDVVTGVFITKGDANEQNDPWKVPYHSYIGRVDKVISHMGHISSILSAMYGKIAAVCLVLFALCLHMIGDIINHR